MKNCFFLLLLSFLVILNSLLITRDKNIENFDDAKKGSIMYREIESNSKNEIPQMNSLEGLWRNYKINLAPLNFNKHNDVFDKIRSPGKYFKEKYIIIKDKRNDIPGSEHTDLMNFKDEYNRYFFNAANNGSYNGTDNEVNKVIREFDELNDEELSKSENIPNTMKKHLLLRIDEKYYNEVFPGYALGYGFNLKFSNNLRNGKLNETLYSNLYQWVNNYNKAIHFLKTLEKYIDDPIFIKYVLSEKYIINRIDNEIDNLYDNTIYYIPKQNQFYTPPIIYELWKVKKLRNTNYNTKYTFPETNSIGIPTDYEDPINPIYRKKKQDELTRLYNIVRPKMDKIIPTLTPGYVLVAGIFGIIGLAIIYNIGERMYITITKNKFK